MKNYILLTIAALSISLSSCSQHDHNHNQETISFDNGQKWSVHENMMVHIQQMVTDVEATAAQGTKDYQALGKKLLANIDLLTSDCTMKGQAHEELHKWLLPFIALANDLENRKSPQSQDAWFKDVQESMREFDRYFK